MTESSIQARWNEVQDALRAALPEASYNTWISNLAIEKITDKELVLGAANKFVKQWVAKNYLNTISEAVRETLGINPTLTIKISAEKFRAHRQSVQEEIEALHSLDSAEKLSLPISSAPEKDTVPFFNQSRHTLTNFIEVPQNSFALSALKQAIQHPGEYSPITVFSDHGLGKTHLLHGLCNSFSCEYPEKKIICVTAQMFVQQFSSAMMNNNITDFRNRYNNSDLLVIDDFQNLGQGKKISSQKELSNILDNLNTLNKQVVIASNSVLHEIPGINSMLSSRISSGLQIRLDPLDTSARETLLKKLEPSLNPEQIVEIAARLKGDIREIEGVLKTIRAVNRFSGNTSREVSLIQSLNLAQKRVSFNISEIIAAVSLEYNIPITDIKSKKRTGDITRARRIAIHLSRRLTDFSLIDIGNEFGGRKHPTIMNILKTAPVEPTRLNLAKLERLLTALGADITTAELLNKQQEIF